MPLFTVFILIWPSKDVSQYSEHDKRSLIVEFGAPFGQKQSDNSTLL